MNHRDIPPVLLVLVLACWHAAPAQAHLVAPPEPAERTPVEPSAGAGAQVPDRLLTVAERSGFQATSRSAEVVEMIDRLAASAGHVHRLEFGATVEGRPLVAAVVASPPVTSPEQLRADPRLVVLLLGNIHSGECAGKEALLMMLRELSLRAGHPWLKNLVIVFVPNYNADANDRVALDNRPGQIGPALGMGRRENAQQLDLNRDFVKLEAPESRALVGLADAWNPHLTIDTHTTNGSRHRYQLTYDVPHNPATSPAIRDFLRGQMMPEITRRLEDQGVDVFYYGNFNSAADRWTTYGCEPRYGVEYFGMRGRLAILSEAYSYITFEERINATRAFTGQCLSYVAGHAGMVQQVLDTARRESEAAAGRVPIRAELAAFDEKVAIKGYESRSSDTPRDYTVTFFGRYDAARDVERPAGYLIPREHSRVADRLRLHGIRLEQLEADTECDVEIYRVASIDRAPTPFQGHRMARAECAVRRERRVVPKGTYLARTSQPLGTLLVYLVEPESDDGLVTWNFFDPLEAAGDVPVLRLPEPIDAATAPVAHVAPGGRLSLDRIYGPHGKIDFGGATAPTWLPNSNRYVEGEGRSRGAIDAATGEYRRDPTPRAMAAALAAIPAIGPEAARELAGRSHPATSDGRGALVEHAGDLYSYDFGAGTATRLTETPETERIPSFSPDGKHVAFVRHNDLWIAAADGSGEHRLTRDGSAETLNGILDWVYQEELYGRGNFHGYWWSPDSSRIAFLQLDERPVHRYTVSDHLPVRGEQEITPYPKAGDPLPRARLGIVDTGGSVTWIDDGADYAPELLVSRVDWSRDSKTVFYQVQDRAQTWLDLRRGEAATGRSSRWFRDQTPAWVNVFGPPYELDDGSVLWLSERSGNKHLYRVSPDGSDLHPLTRGDWDVQTVEGLDQNREWVYLTATRDSPLAACGYRLRVEGGELERITPGDGHHVLSFSASREFFFDTHSTVHSPPQVRLYRADGTLVQPIGTGANDFFAHIDIREPERHKVPTRNGQLMDAMLIKPPDFDPAKKYPVLVYVYSGPQAPVVRDRWGGERYLWHQLIAQQGYCVWMCDNRSATLRGAGLAWPIHRDLGRRELEDIEDGVGWLAEKPWVDSERIGIWGWSYGGYMTAYALTHSELFKIGISGAPVTDWRNYDAIYTERYMGLPQDNPQGYDDSSVVKAAANLHGKLLLVHGTIDDNVHLSNTLQLAHALQQAGKQFDLMLYPKSRHAVTDEHQLRHLRELMTRFVLDHL